MRKAIDTAPDWKFREHVLDLFVIVFAVILFLIVYLIPADAQSSPIYTFPPASQPVCAATWDIPNKLVTTSCTIAGVVVAPISYNPRVLEGNAGGVFTITFAGVTITYTHNLAADPLKYTVGATPSGSGTIVQCGAAPSPACPVIPW
jgi:hypothetical protein